MRMKLSLVVAIVAVCGTAAGGARAEKPPHELAGQPFYFGGTCTGIGDVVLVNQSLAHTAALRIVGAHGVVLQGTRGIEEHANAECTITGGGFSPDSIEPFDEPFSLPARIVG
jgi:hypothetical protein